MKGVFKRLSDLYAALKIRELDNSWFRFVMLRTYRLQNLQNIFAINQSTCYRLIKRQQ